MAKYTPEQRRNIAIANRRSRRDPPRVRLALLEAMGVEANFRHVGYGDRDSLGVLQQRPSQGWGAYNPKDPTEDIDQFLERARRNNRGFKGTAGQLAQSVQRSAFPGRYDERAKEAKALLGLGLGARFNARNDPGLGQPISFGVDSGMGGMGQRRSIIAAHLLESAKSRLSDTEGPSLMSLASQLGQLKSEVPSLSTLTQQVAAKGGKQGVRFGPKNMPASVRAGLLAQKMGLRVSENPYFDQVDPVHTEGSDHYRTVGRYRGRKFGAALDVSGDPKKLARYFKILEAQRATYGLDDMFYDPMKYSYDEGRRWGKTIGGHGTHVHASFN